MLRSIAFKDKNKWWRLPIPIRLGKCDFDHLLMKQRRNIHMVHAMIFSFILFSLKHDFISNYVIYFLHSNFCFLTSDF
jgi:hypothetical protein